MRFRCSTCWGPVKSCCAGVCRVGSIVENHSRCLVSKPRHPYSHSCAELCKPKIILKEFQALNPEKKQLIDEEGSSRHWSLLGRELALAAPTCCHASWGSLGHACLILAAIVGATGGFGVLPRGQQPPSCSRGWWAWRWPVPFAVVQGAAGSEGFVVILPPSQQGHHGPKGSKQPCKHCHGDGGAPLHLAPCRKRREQRVPVPRTKEPGEAGCVGPEPRAPTPQPQAQASAHSPAPAYFVPAVPRVQSTHGYSIYPVLKSLLINIYVNIYIQPDNKSCPKNTAGQIFLPVRSLLSLEQEIWSSTLV